MKKLQALFVQSLVWIILFAGPLALLVGAYNLLTSPARSVGGVGITGGSTYRLSSSIGTSNTTLSLSSFKEPVSNIKYTMNYLGATIAYGTIDPNTSSSEFVSFSGITQNSNGSATLTGVARGLSRTPAGSSCTASSTLAQAHSGQSIFILSDSPCLFAEIPFKANNETITGQWTFSTFPITPSNASSSETVAGIVQLATNAQAVASTLLGSTGARLVLPASMATSTYNSRSAPFSVLMTGATGSLDLRFLGTTTIALSTTTVNGIALASTTVTTFDSSGTWTRPTSGTMALIEAWGGGGSGGSRSTTGDASGGGGGGYASRIVRLSDLGTTETVTVPAAAAGVSGNNSGSNGGTVTFGSWLTAYGGGAGYNTTAVGGGAGGGGGGPMGAGGAGGATSGAAGSPGGSLSGAGAVPDGSSGLYSGAGGGTSTGGGGLSGSAGSAYYGGGGGGAATAGSGGSGGSSVLAGAGGAGNNAGNATAGSAPAGGGGASRTGTSGAGGAGRVKITVY